MPGEICMSNDQYDWNQSYFGDASDYEPADADLLSIIDQLPQGRALDVGCGAGGLVVALAERGWTVTGIDIAESAIAAARRVAEDRGIDVEFHVADATSWRPPTEYDLITNSFALPGTRAARGKVYRMIRSSLAYGGTVLIKDFDSSMNRVEFFSGFDLVTINELSTAFEGLDIIRAEVVRTPAHEHSTGIDSADPGWSAALFHAVVPICRHVVANTCQHDPIPPAETGPIRVEFNLGSPCEDP